MNTSARRCETCRRQSEHRVTVSIGRRKWALCDDCSADLLETMRRARLRKAPLDPFLDAEFDELLRDLEDGGIGGPAA